MNHNRRLVLLIFTIVGIGAGAAKALGGENERIKSEFDARYAAWLDWRHQHLSPDSAGDAAELFGNEPFRALVELGVGAVPYMIEKVQEDHLLGHALYRITKWRYHVTRSGANPTEYVWTVDEFPDLSSAGGPPDARVLWLRWWETGREEVPERFAELFDTWRALREQGEEQAAAETYERIKDLGIVVLPLLIEKAQKGDRDVIPAILYLSDGEVVGDSGATSGRRKRDPSPSECVAWWEKNGEKWVLPPARGPAESSGKRKVNNEGR